MPTAMEYRLYGWHWNDRRWLSTLHADGGNDFSKVLAVCNQRWLVVSEVSAYSGVKRNSVKWYLRAGYRKGLLLRRRFERPSGWRRGGFQPQYEYRLMDT